jgi:hypothetical protein
VDFDVTDRYAGRPLLRLVEFYVLDAIGQISENDASRLAAIAPNISAAVGSDAGTWQGAISDALTLPGDFPATLMNDWLTAKAEVAASGGSLAPEVFAAGVADSFTT